MRVWHQESPLTAPVVKLSLSSTSSILPILGQSNHPRSSNINFLLTLREVCYYHLVEAEMIKLKCWHLWGLKTITCQSDRVLGARCLDRKSDIPPTTSVQSVVIKHGGTGAPFSQLSWHKMELRLFSDLTTIITIFQFLRRKYQLYSDNTQNYLDDEVSRVSDILNPDSSDSR